MKFIARSIIGLLFIFFYSSPPGICYKPKTHLYLALRAIQPILQGNDQIEIGGFQYRIDIDIATAIRAYPGYYLGGVIGPDGFPDIFFGQMIVHTDKRCKEDDKGIWNCDTTSGKKTWSWEWFEHLYTAAQKLSGEEKKKALAFVIGYITHGAGDMWAHTFVNHFAGGSWKLLSKIAPRHIIIESVIEYYTPSIKEEVAALGGIQAPMDFIAEQFFNSPWARDRSKASFSGFFMDLKEKLEKVNSKGIFFLLRPYITCWIKKIELGLLEWPKLSLRVSEDMFVNGQTDSAFKRVEDFKAEHFDKMISWNSAGLVADCMGRPDLDPARVKRKIKKDLKNTALFKKWYKKKREFSDYLFEKAFGFTLDSLKKLLKYPMNFLDPCRGIFEDGDREKILAAIPVDSATRFFKENDFAIAHNTIQLEKMIFLGPGELDRMLADFNAGPLYTSDTLNPSKKINVMMGFIRSLDGNHQWALKSPPLPVKEASRKFGDGMPLWTDCTARNNFFKKVFKDWSVEGVSMIYHQVDDCK